MLGDDTADVLPHLNVRRYFYTYLTISLFAYWSFNAIYFLLSAFIHIPRGPLFFPPFSFSSSFEDISPPDIAHCICD